MAMKDDTCNQITNGQHQSVTTFQYSGQQTDNNNTNSDNSMIAPPRNNPLLEATTNSSGPQSSIAWGNTPASASQTTESESEQGHSVQAIFDYQIDQGGSRDSWEPGGLQHSADDIATSNQHPASLSGQSLLQPEPRPPVVQEMMRSMQPRLKAENGGAYSEAPIQQRQLHHSHSMPAPSSRESVTNTTGWDEDSRIHSQVPDAYMTSNTHHHQHAPQSQSQLYSQEHSRLSQMLPNFELTASSSQSQSKHLSGPRFSHRQVAASQDGGEHFILSGLTPESPVSAMQLGGTTFSTNGHQHLMAPSQGTAAVATSGMFQRYSRHTQSGLIGSGPLERRSPPPPIRHGTSATGSGSGPRPPNQQQNAVSGSSSSRLKPNASNSSHPFGLGQGHSRSNPPSPRMAGLRPPSHHGHGGPGLGHGTGGAGAGSHAPVHNHGPRTPPEILKTLLRKKACLYEAGGTSYAIALVTWLVGRELALKTGYFTRQELQYGVHNVVGEIIDSGSITRTKVNRCMQIILNSCFHYIIPSVGAVPAGLSGGDGGSVEDLKSAKRFREEFARRAASDDDLLWTLDAPWHGLDVDEAIRDLVQDKISEGDECPPSPKLTFQRRLSVNQSEYGTPAPAPAPDSPRNKAVEDDDSSIGSSKRVVLLCFNENVNSFEEVWRCHNEFIRDVAHSGNLRLASREWKDFFTRVSQPMAATSVASAASHHSPSMTSHCGTTECSSSEDGSRFSPTAKNSPNRPAGLPPVIPEFSLDDGHQMVSKAPPSYAAAASSTAKVHATDMDTRFVSMDAKELNTFRTTWCSKRYDHDPSVCAFAHVEVNRGWIRRDPHAYQYRDEFCSDVELVRPNAQHYLEGCLINRCAKGVNCEYCHSQEEIDYHPDRYKKQAVCPSSKDGASGAADPFDTCEKGTVCPFLHTPPHGSQSSGRGHHSDRGHRRSGSDGGVRHGKGHPRSPKGKGNLNTNSASGTNVPQECAMLYVDQAPTSELEKSFGLPGLRSLFRQRCAVSFSHLMRDSSSPQALSSYSHFEGSLLAS
jgi:hypothetical protein